VTTTFDERIRDLVAYAYEHAPAVRDNLEAANLTPADIQGADDLPKIPILRKDDLIAMQAANPPFGGLLTVAPDTLPHIFISPGPIYDPQPDNPEAAQGMQAVLAAGGFEAGDRVLNTFSYHLTPAGMLIDRALLNAGCTVIPAGPGNTEIQIKMIHDLAIQGYVGTPSFLAIMLEKMIEMGLPKEAVPVKKAFFSAEPYTPSQRALFEDEYGMQTVSAYGTADLGVIAYASGAATGFCVLDHLYLEVVDPDTGEAVEAGMAGEILVTTINYAYPLIRFGTGDLGALAADADAACDGRQQLLGLFGRSGDAIKVRGMFLHPNQLKAAIARVPQIKYAQAVITRPQHRDHLTVLVELHEDADDVAHIEAAVKAHLQGVARLRVDDVQLVESGAIDPQQRSIIDERTWE